MRNERDFRDFLICFNKYRVNYCIIGGFSVIYHSRPRFTNDMDILIKPSSGNSKKVYKAMKDFGADVSNIDPDYFIAPGHFYQIGVPPVQIHILNFADGVDMDKVFKNKIKAQYANIRAYYIALNDVIKNKQSSGRNKDKLDVEALKLAKEKSKKSSKNRKRGQSPFSI
ncbi:MAG: hypothetical protein J7M11_04340 [Elusimicrobia bacterium]|nr:hypothetical protein [Elusimicrobiota bacterium]